MHNNFEQSAKRASLTADKVQRARLSETTKGLLYYLYWRNRFPVLTRFVTRFILLVEIYVVYAIFSAAAAASLSIIIFTVLIARGAFQGITQYFRLEIVAAEQQGKHSALPALNRLLQQFSVVYGLGIGVLTLILACLLGDSNLPVVFAASWAIVLPLQLSSSSYWVAVYTKRRLRRSFWLVIGARLIPLAFVLTLSTPLGIYSYPLGLLIGRILEFSYLRSLARQELEHNKHVSEEAQVGKTALKKILINKKFWGLFAASSAFFIFQLLVGLPLYLRGNQLWFAHFSFFFVLMTISFVPLRIPFSLGFDLYLALKAGNIIRAKRLISISRKFMWAAILAIAGLSIFLLVAQTAIFTVGQGLIYSLFIYYIGLLLVRTWFQGEFTLLRTAGLEASGFSVAALLLIVIAGFFEFFLIQYYRANLPMVYLVEIGIFLLASILLMKQMKSEKSEIYKRFFTETFARGEVLAPWLWVDKVRSSQALIAFYFIQLDSRYHQSIKSNALIRKLKSISESEIFITELAPTFFVFGIPSEEAAAIIAKLRSDFAGHVRNVVSVERAKGIEENVNLVIESLKKVREAPRALRAYASYLHVIKKTALFKLLSELREVCPINASTKVLSKNIADWLESYLGRKLNGVFFDGNKIRLQGDVSTKCLEIAHKLCVTEGGSSRFLPILRSPVVSINYLHIPLIVLDTKGFSQEEIQKLYLASLLIFLASVPSLLDTDKNYMQFL
ncbi:MAG: hypothetical protein R3A13_04445 [Bdellovibrionota bacterium]